MFPFSKLFLVLLPLIVSIKADEDAISHFEDPDEMDVVNPPRACKSNKDGFGGSLTEDYFEVEYYVEMLYLSSGVSAETLVQGMETETVDYLLQSSLFDLPCSKNNGQISVKAASIGNKAVGITTNPGDEILDGIPCKTIEYSKSDQTLDCKVISAAFQVYYEKPLEDDLDGEFHSFVRQAINQGEIVFSSPDIVQVVAVDLKAGGNSDKKDEANKDSIKTSQDDSGTNTPVIIGATVGACLVLGAVALYRRRQAGAEGETTFTPDPKQPTEI